MYTDFSSDYLFNAEVAPHLRTVRFSGIPPHVADVYVVAEAMARLAPLSARVEDSASYFQADYARTVVMQVSSQTGAKALCLLNGTPVCGAYPQVAMSEMCVQQVRNWIAQTTVPAAPAMYPAAPAPAPEPAPPATVVLGPTGSAHIAVPVNAAAAAAAPAATTAPASTPYEQVPASYAHPAYNPASIAPAPYTPPSHAYAAQPAATAAVYAAAPAHYAPPPSSSSAAQAPSGATYASPTYYTPPSVSGAGGATAAAAPADAGLLPPDFLLFPPRA